MSDPFYTMSKYLSYILRHNPSEAGITLDQEGWTRIDELLASLNKSGKHISRIMLEDLVKNNAKKRFTISDDGLRIRAAQGHSLSAVDISFIPRMPPDVLYHGTASRFVESIMENGLHPKSRQYVHLSPDRETAKNVGRRYGVPVVLLINTRDMHNSGIVFHQADNGVWLTKFVDPKFITILADSES